MVQEILKKTVSETSRLSGLGIEKFLMPNEMLIYATIGNLYVGTNNNDIAAGFKGYVTKNRIIFYKRAGLIFKSDIINEIPLNQITSYNMVEEGIVFKKMHLKLNQFKINGERSDILEMYRAIQAAKNT